MSTTTTDTTSIALAAEHLEGAGYTIVASETMSRWGAVELVAHADDCLVFVSVAVDVDREQSQEARRNEVALTRKRAAAWLADHWNRYPRSSDVRFDHITVTHDGGQLLALDHFEAVA